MINSTPSPGNSPLSNAVSLSQTPSSYTRGTPVPRDSLSLDQADGLNSALASQPEIRPEMLEKGRALAADPNYPPLSVIQQVAGQIVNSPDLSEEQV
jgi:hypothetical protein